ncbi:NlpC/P60 family protein [Methylorubrum extorquens]|uniref:NlpC/P60 family protein n=1 Tax=Methylorubrum extorquens TaxID=408 RepID=UPI001EE61DD0|nr:NlpC/P60 family protein [Methylorubrum extorquens]MCG5247987.1 C40 family peptidase [Methylorubrum extorquens]
MHWSEPYIGLPWQDRGLARDGVACWGLARLVYAEVLGLAVPDYAAEVASLDNRAKVATVYADGTMLGPWRSVPESEAREFDILVFRRAGLDAHVGIVVAPGRMLHITSGQDSAIVSYADGRWAPRISGVYRHVALVERARAA